MALSDRDREIFSDHGFTGHEIAWLDQNLDDRPQDFSLTIDSDSKDIIRQIVETESQIAKESDLIAREILEQKVQHLENQLGEQTTGTAWWKALIVRDNFIEEETQKLMRTGKDRTSARAEVFMTIDSFYLQDEDASPWTFLRAEYRKSLQQTVSDYTSRAQEMARRKTGKLYE